jgi:D-glycero-alpha-D-manno-heptose-7-phosphate kinase
LELRDRLQAAQDRGEPPTIIARHRIDGPGSTLDMREFQQGLWRPPVWPDDPNSDPSAAWSAELPRTICLTIDTGTRVDAHPYQAGMIAVQSSEYGTEVVARSGQVAATQENWLVKTIDAFGLSGLAFHLHSLRPGLLSAGLRGSATAMTAVCLLANRLAGDPMDGHQIVGLASRLE